MNAARNSLRGPQTSRRTSGFGVPLLMLLCLALPAGGCLQAQFALFEKLFPEDKVPPEYKLPGGKKVLVFTDDIDNPVEYSPIKRIVSDKVSAVLREKKLAAETIPYERIMDLQASHQDFYRMPVAAVGRQLGADLVIYIALERFSLKETPLDTLWKGALSAKVRVIDVWKGKLWPEKSDGRVVTVNTPEVHNTSETYSEVLAQQLGEQLAGEVAGLFHEHWVPRAHPKEGEFSPQE